MKNNKKEFFYTRNGEDYSLYTLGNSKGSSVSITDFGGIITSLSVKDRYGDAVDVVLGFSDFSDYFDRNPYFGTITGRYANRIAGGTFSLSGKKYTLAKNEPPNHLHGGLKGFDKVKWEVKEYSGEHIILEYFSPDGEEGYPGNMTVQVTYLLTEDNELIISYTASSDSETIINLTNHSYFNLAGSGDIRDHRLQLFSDSYLPVGKDGLPVAGFKAVAGTPFDLRDGKLLGNILDSGYVDILEAEGIDHCFSLSLNQRENQYAAVLECPETGIRMKVKTTEPGIQVYTSNMLEKGLKGKSGDYAPYYAVCLETQHFPDSPNRPDFPSTVLKKDEIYATNTVYSFETFPEKQGL